MNTNSSPGAVNADSSAPTPSSAEVASEHIGQLDPKFAHRLTCQRCKAQMGQVLRQGSDFFDCLECGNFTYVKGINQQAHQRALASPTKASPVTRAPAAWMRKWAFDGEKPAKVKNEAGRWVWPAKFKMMPVSIAQCFPDDVPLAASPQEPKTDAARNAQSKEQP